ncbi:CDP-glycerol glycerophosphotransferase family protein [Clostridium botulinum]|uniref:CDP-glycerol glycerophosphotransferase family protein n=1 Tax=Clostridium botulinum TaxID=1491 RepID=UPI001968494D|nr:CDP-glycerol glycerophosphotransferase family protein [Clostridium botulinum]MBN1060031.1 CDP-glycerol--poly(glycerophosphate) glycerophosphotransferase [Clostridium botulinum]MBN1063177.1 CDP-glycerol--poly(glycerophosphate) glycerophosphotransferase [Clostridium botulinum]
MKKNIFIKIVYIIISYISMLSIRSKNIYIFGAWFGEKFSDNSKYLYLQALKNNNKKAIWITKNSEVYTYLKKKNSEVYMYNSLKGIFYQLRAKYYFTCTSAEDVNSCLLGRAVHINLWHGIPLKKIMWDDKISNSYYEKNKIKKVISDIYNFVLLIPRHNQYVLSSSSTITQIYTSAFKIKKERILELGQPRNDVYFDNSIEDKKFPNLYKEKTVILYMPTHRNEGKIKFNISDLLNLNKLDKFCEKNNIIFLIKKHFYHANEVEDLTKFKNIIDITNTDFDSQLLLKYANLLITDYSSCYIDYLLLNRPMIFYCFDYKQYTTNDRDLYFNYADVTPGIRVNDFEELFISISRIIVDKKDEFKIRRREVKDLFYDKKNQDIVSYNIFKLVKEEL